MEQQAIVERFTKDLFEIFEETFESVHGIYLDRGTSLFETLAGISADEASRPVSATCASIAGQVTHVVFYLEVLERVMHGESVGKIDWKDSWKVTQVSSAEWETLKDKLKQTYARLLALFQSLGNWDGENDIGGALAIVVHTAYHLGEIRQALCTIKQ